MIGFLFFKQERRKEKKTNSLAFKEEKKLQEKQHINNRKNISGIKLLLWFVQTSITSRMHIHYDAFVRRFWN
jgi:hypothetical protein